MSKTIKITKSQINNLINEEVVRFKKIKSLENRKNEIISQLNEMYELEELTELGIDEGFFDNVGSAVKTGMQKVTNALTKSYPLNGQLLAASKNKNNLQSYGKQIAKLKALGMSDAQAQETAAILLDTNQMASYANGHITPAFDKATGSVKLASTAAIGNPNVNAPE